MTIFSLIEKDNFDEFEAFLHQLSKDGTKEIIETRDENGFTPLHFAAVKKSDTFLKLLLEMHADPNVLSFDTQEYLSSTPIQKAMDAGLYSNVSLLLQYKANPNLKNGEEKPTLILAIEAKQYKIAALLAFYSDLSLTDETGSTAMHWSASKGLAKLTLLLLSLGADPNITNALFSPIVEAALKGHLDVCEILKNAGAKTAECLNEQLIVDGIISNEDIDRIQSVINEIENKFLKEGKNNSPSIMHALDLAQPKSGYFSSQLGNGNNNEYSKRIKGWGL